MSDTVSNEYLSNPRPNERDASVEHDRLSHLDAAMVVIYHTARAIGAIELPQTITGRAIEAEPLIEQAVSVSALRQQPTHIDEQQQQMVEEDLRAKIEQIHLDATSGKAEPIISQEEAAMIDVPLDRSTESSMPIGTDTNAEYAVAH